MFIRHKKWLNERYDDANTIFTDLDFSSIEEYYDYIGESYINGLMSQVKSLYNKMDDKQKGRTGGCADGDSVGVPCQANRIP